MIYDSVELSQFDMFKEEVLKLHEIAQDLNADQIRWAIDWWKVIWLITLKSIVEDKIDFVIMGLQE
jgi:hypothetical protein